MNKLNERGTNFFGLPRPLFLKISLMFVFGLLLIPRYVLRLFLKFNISLCSFLRNNIDLHFLLTNNIVVGLLLK